MWFSVFVAIETLDLRVILHKVKAHNNNRFNDLTDHLAKAACELSPTISFNYNRRFAYAPLYKGIEIEVNLRRFIKDITSAKEIVTFLHQKRNVKYNTCRIDWLNTAKIINGDEAVSSTSFNSSYIKSKKVKLLLEELPTLDFLKATKPKLYDNTWQCVFCGQNETFNHIWTCSHHVTLFDDIIVKIKNKLYECLSTIVSNFDFNNEFYQRIISHGSWWTVAYEPVTITFIDLIKGVVLFDLSDYINNITNNKEATLEVLRHVFQCLYELTQNIWLERCKLIVHKEESLNISGKMKKQIQFGGNKFERSAYVDQSLYLQMPKTISSTDSLIDKMVTRGCHFSNF